MSGDPEPSSPEPTPLEQTPLEPTLPTERTRLAWQRTVLAATVCLLGVLRLLANISVPLVAVAGIVLVISGAVFTAVSIRRSVRGRQLVSDTGVGRNAAMLTAIVALACLGAMVYAILV